jgi:hypothetical protein
VILGVTGHARHGKDSVAEILVRRCGYTRVGLADPLKEACRVMFGWTREHTDGAFKETIDPTWGISPRKVMQLLGTEFGQFELSRHEEFASTTGRCLWTRRALLAAQRAGGDVVIPDVRFHHEADAIRSAGGLIVRVIRTGHPICRLHASESEMDGILADVEFYNDGTLADLERKVLARMGVN